MTITKAKELATRYHQGQVDKAGVPYINHPTQVARMVKGKEAKIVAYLHDLLEDTKCQPKEILETFNLYILNAVKVLTRKPNQTYEDYILQIKSHPVARQVKIADLKHNISLMRIENITKADVERSKKYLSALAELI